MPLFTADYLRENKPQSVPSIIGSGLLPPHGILLLTAQTGVGKSVIALDICYSLLLGEPLFGAYRKRNDKHKDSPYFPVHSVCRILYLDSELGQIGMHQRLLAIHELRSPGLNFGNRFQVLTEHYDPLSLHAQGKDDKALKRLREIIVTAAPEPDSGIQYVVVFDPLGDFHHLDEDNNMMRFAMNTLKSLQREIGFAAIVPHHQSDKPMMTQLGPMTRRGTSKSRGHSSIAQAVDSMCSLEADEFDMGRGFLRLEWTKVRHGARPGAGWLYADFSKMLVKWVCPARGTQQEKLKMDFKKEHETDVIPEE